MTDRFAEDYRTLESHHIDQMGHEEAQNELRYACGIIDLLMRQNDALTARAEAAEQQLKELREDYDSHCGDLSECANSLGIELLPLGLGPRIHGFTLAVRGMVDEMEQQLSTVQAENTRLREALAALLPFIEEDFMHGPDGSSCASDAYRAAYKLQLAALAGEGK